MIVRKGNTVYRVTDFSGQGLRFSSKHKPVKVPKEMQAIPPSQHVRVTVRRNGKVLCQLF